eukprot:Gb_18795 [translate_table: standard]
MHIVASAIFGFAPTPPPSGQMSLEVGLGEREAKNGCASPPVNRGKKNLMAERRQRKKLNDRLYMLRSMVPKISKVMELVSKGDKVGNRGDKNKDEKLDGDGRGGSAGSCVQGLNAIVLWFLRRDPTAMPSVAAISIQSSLEDPFEDDRLTFLMPKTFEGFVKQDSLDPFNIEAHTILRQEALKNANKDTEQANAILTSIASLVTKENHSHLTSFCIAGSMEEMTQQPELGKENILPNENCSNWRARREGTGRTSTRRPFSINSSSFGSNLNVQRDPKSLQDVGEFWAAAQRWENGDALFRKMKGEKSPDSHCSQQSLKTRVRRQGTGRRTTSKNFDVKLAEKHIPLDEEKLEEEDEEYPLSTFTNSQQQGGEILTETGNIEINKDALCKEPESRGGYLCKTVNEKLQSENGSQLNGIGQSAMQTDDQSSMAHGGEIDDCHPSVVRAKETFSALEAEETVNMPPKNLLSYFQNSTGRALHLLLQDCKKLDTENMVPVSRFGHGSYDMGLSYAEDLYCDRPNALPQSQTESSNTIYSHSFCADEANAILKMQQLQMKSHLEDASRTPPENLQQKATKACSPLTSPTPPSKIYAALKSRRKRKSAVQTMLEDTHKPSVKNKDEETEKIHTSTHTHSSNSHSISNPIKQREDGGIRRLSFDSVSQSPMHDGVNSKEGLNDVLDVGLANSSSPCKQCTEDEASGSAVEIVGNDPIDIVLGHKKTTPASSTELHKCNTDVSESPPKDILSSASPRQVEESPATLHEKNAKKVGDLFSSECLFSLLVL